MTGTSALLVALIGAPVLGTLLGGWIQRRKTGADTALTITQAAEQSIRLTTQSMDRMRSELSDLRIEIADQREEISHLGQHIHVLTMALRTAGIDPPPMPPRLPSPNARKGRR